MMELRDRLRAMVRRVRASPPVPEDRRLWLDTPGAEARIRQLTDPTLQAHARDLLRDGFTCIPGNVAPELCDQVVKDFRAYCDANEASKTYRDEWGYHSRLSNLHMVSDRAMEIGMNARVLHLLDTLLGRRTAVCGCLLFERGTQQAIHRDSPFFYTSPPGLFFGVWTALEDIRPESGPLRYYQGGHRIPIDQLAIGRRHPDGDIAAMFNEYTKEVDQACRAAGLTDSTACLRKGDTLIWHPELPHGGSVIQDRTLTRKSIVFHYLPEQTPISGPLVFFRGESSTVLPQYRHSHGRDLIDHGQPRFDHNY
jgi:hypothetical protein